MLKKHADLLWTFLILEVNPPAPAPATAPVVSEKTVVEEAVQQVPPIASAPAIAPLSAVPKSTKEASSKAFHNKIDPHLSIAAISPSVW